MPQPCVRPATEQDINALITLYIEFHEFHVRGMPDRLRIPEMYDYTELRQPLKRIIASDRSTIFVADVSGVLVGLAEVYLRQDEPASTMVTRTYGYLQSLMVLEAFRHKQVGSQLVAVAEQWARAKRASEMQFETWEFERGPLHFYEALNYRTLKRRLVRDLSKVIL